MPTTLANFLYPGVVVNDFPFGSIPIGRAQFNTIYYVVNSLRGPTLEFVPVTTLRAYEKIFGPRFASGFGHHAARAIDSNGRTRTFVVRVKPTGSAKASVTLIKAGSDAEWTLTLNCTSVVVNYDGQDTASLTVATLTAAALQTALEGLSTIGAGNVAVTGATGGPFNIKLAGTLSHTVAETLTATPTGGAAIATVVVVDPGVEDIDVLKITAVGEGADYNYTAGPPAHGISVRYVSGLLEVWDGPTLLQVYSNVVFGNAAVSEQIVAGDNIQQAVVIEWLDTTVNPDDYSANEGLAGGLNGSAVGDAQYLEAIALLEQENLSDGTQKPLGLYLCPGVTSQAVGQALITAATNSLGAAVLDSTLGISSSQAKTERSQYASPRGFGNYIWPWVETTDLDTGAKIFVPPSPFVAALWLKSHAGPGSIANVGAGTAETLQGATGLKTYIDDLTQGDLNDFGVTCLRNFRNRGYGLVSWGARTISPDVLYRFRHVRVILNVISRSLQNGLLPYVFKPMDGRGELKAQIQGSIENLLATFWRGDVLFGATPQEAFLVRIDPDLSELEQGVLGIEVYIKPVPIIERINVSLFRVPLTFSFQNSRGLTVQEGLPTAA